MVEVGGFTSGFIIKDGKQYGLENTVICSDATQQCCIHCSLLQRLSAERLILKQILYSCSAHLSCHLH